MIVHSSLEKQVPALRIAIDEANRNAPVGMTQFFVFLKGKMRVIAPSLVMPAKQRCDI